MTIKYFPELIQGSDEWLAARIGILTASEVHKILTPTLKIADNEKTGKEIKRKKRQGKFKDTTGQKNRK